MTWYKTAQEDQLKQVASQLVDEVWEMGVIEEEDKYNGFQVSVIIDNEYPLYQKAMQFGEESYERIKDLVEEELIQREQRDKFDPRKEELESIGGDLPHLQKMIKGTSWEEAKRRIMDMGPGGAFHDPDMVVEDEFAENVFRRLWSANVHGTFLSLETLKGSSPFVTEDGTRIMKRLSELRPRPRAETSVDRNAYEENQIYLHLFGNKGMPEKIRVFRGVSRADAKIRPGDYTTPSRDYANSYLRGPFGAVVQDFVSPDDLIVGTTNVGYAEVELVYYPRSYQHDPEQEKEDAPQMTYREFWGKVNGNGQ